MNNVYNVVGRIIAIRQKKHFIFADITEKKGIIQLMIENTNDNIEKFKVSDIVKVDGILTTTKIGYKSIRVLTLSVIVSAKQSITKSTISDQYRDRYLKIIDRGSEFQDFITMNEIVQFIRSYLLKNHFLEVDTPYLHEELGSAGAIPFETYSHAKKKQYYLRRNGELYQKKILIATGLDIFEIGKVFRNQGLSKTTMSEYWMLDIYKINEDYLFGMELLTHMLEEMFQTVDNLDTTFFKFPIPKLSFKEVIKPLLNKEDINQLKMKQGEFEDYLFNKYVKPKIINATIFYDFPAELNPLARPNCDQTCQEFKLVVNGISIAHGYSELNDYELQVENLEKQYAKNLRKKDVTLEESFIDALGYGLYPSVGIGVGINRLLMVLLNRNNVRETTLFPCF